MTRGIRYWFVLFAAAIAAVPFLESTGLATMAWPDLLDRPRPKADQRIAYGPDPLQHVDLWRPRGPGPYPVVVMIHGGCWQTDVAEADIMNYIADDLRGRGIAVWNIEYRGVDRMGGGYPGTFLDVAAAADLLRRQGGRYRLRTDRIVAIGHSAGGHLAFWLAARPRIPHGDTLSSRTPLRLAEAISIGGLPDLRAAQTPPGDTCDAEPVHRLVGTPTSSRPDPYADTSPAELLPFPTPQVLLNATRDRIAPPAFAEAYDARARAKGVTVRRVTIADEGHVELITPETKSWAAARAEIERVLRR